MDRIERLTSDQIDFLVSVVGRDKFNQGESALDLHCRDFGFSPCHRPAAVAWPQNTDQVSRIMAWAAAEGMPVTPFGAGTSTEGNPIPAAGGVVLNMTDMNRIINVSAEDMQVEVEPGLDYKTLNHSLRHQGLFFPPDPGASATIGGMIANNASGVMTVKYGATKDYVMGLEMVLPGGQVIQTGTRAPKSSSGYDLTRLIVGSEGTFGVVTRAWLRLAGRPEHIAAVVTAFEDIDAATTAVQQLIQSGIGPAALELLTAPLVELMNREGGLDLPAAPALFVELHGFSESGLTEALDMAEVICRDLGAVSFETGMGRENRDRLWETRHAVAEIIKRAHPGLENLITDAAVPLSVYSRFIAFCHSVVEEENLTGYIFGHAGDGNLHLVWPGDPTDKQTWARIENANRRVVEFAIESGGTATGEHGIGIGKRKFMEAEHGASVEIMRRIKAAFDPQGIMNPGKMLP